MISRPLKIAVSGAVSTGKTTFATALSEKLGLPLIDEQMDKVFVVPKGERGNRALRARRINHTLETKRAIELEQGSFVADRCPLDLLNFWFGLLLHQSPEGSSESDAFVARCESYLAEYDYIVLLPYGVLPVVQKVNSPLSKRNMDKWSQLLGSVRIQGFARHFLPEEKLIEMPKDIIDMDERIEFVLSRIAQNPSE